MKSILEICDSTHGTEVDLMLSFGSGSGVSFNASSQSNSALSDDFTMASRSLLPRSSKAV